MATSDSTSSNSVAPAPYKQRGGSVYLVTNTVNNKRYVGKTVKSLVKRWQQHVASARLKNTYLANAILKYGAENFTIEIIEEVPDHDTLLVREQEWIARLNTLAPNGYNLTCGGEGMVGLKPSPESIAKGVAKRRGRPLSQETRDKIGAAHKGRPGNHAPKSELTKQRMREAKRKPRTPEHSAKLSIAQKGKPKGPQTPEHRANSGAARKGKPILALQGVPRSEEVKRVISEKLMGHSVSEATREKLRQAALKQWEVKRQQAE